MQELDLSRWGQRLRTMAVRPSVLVRWVVVMLVLPGTLFGTWSLPSAALATTNNPPTPGPTTEGPPECQTCPAPEWCSMLLDMGEEAPEFTEWPIAYHDGSVTEQVTDLTLPGPLFNWSQARTYNSLLPNAQTTSLGRSWTSNNCEMRLSLDNITGEIRFLTTASSQRTFKPSGGGYASPQGTSLKLVHVGNMFEQTNEASGAVLVFYDFTHGDLSGRLYERTTRTWQTAGKAGQIYSYSGGRISSITTAEGQDEIISFSYVAASDQIRSIKIGSLTPTDEHYLAVEYTYKGDNVAYSSDLGSDDDLVQVKISRKASDGNWIHRYTQYRYFSTGKLKSVFEKDAIYRIVEDNSNIGTPDDILTQSDSYATGGSQSIANFASRSFTYITSNETTSSLESAYGGTGFDETGRAKSETVNGACGSCGGGGGASGVTYEYSYLKGANAVTYDNNGGDVSVEANPTVAGWINVVYWITIEDVKANSTLLRRNIYGLSKNGQLLRKATLQDPSAGSPLYWCNSQKMRNDRRILEKRMPSAYVGLSSISTFLDPFDGSTWTDPLDADGQIHVYEYASNGWPTGARVKKGPSGTAYYVSATDYGNGTDEATWEVVATYSYPTQTTTRADGIKTEYEYTYWDSSPNFNRRKVKTTKTAAVPTSQNGPNVQAVTEEHFNAEGQLVWTKDAEGYLHKKEYDAVTGAVTTTITDAAQVSGSPTRGTGLPTALAITTSYEYDKQGRLIKTVDAGGGEHCTSYLTDRTIRYPYWTGSTTLLSIEVTAFNEGDQKVDSYALDPGGVTVTTTGSPAIPISITGEAQSDRVRWSHVEYDNRGRMSEQRAYHVIPSGGDGSAIDNYYAIGFVYNAEGMVQSLIQDISSSRKQESEVTRDFLGRVTQTRRGLGVGGSPASLIKVSETAYDNGGVGDGFKTNIKTYFGIGVNDYMEVRLHYTYRGHLRGVEPQDSGASTIVPVTLYDVDWLGRTTAIATLASNPSWSTLLNGSDGYAIEAAASSQSARRTLTVTMHDDLGRRYRNERYEVNQSTGALGDIQRSDSYYDQLNHVVASVKYNRAATEIVYDGVGRAYQTRVVKALEGGNSGGGGMFYSSGKFIYRDPQPASSFSSASTTAMSGGNDQMIQLTHSYLDAAGNTLETHTFEVNHNDTNGLNVAETGGSVRDYVRSSVYSWYDDASRLVTTANYGSGDIAGGWGEWKYASMPARPGTAPTGSDQTKLVTTYTYDAAGQQATSAYKQTSLKTITTKTFYDDLGRIRYQANNFVNFSWTPSTNSISGTGGGADKDEDNVTAFEYNGLGSMIKLIALDQNADGTATDNETTEYKYEDTYNASLQTEAKYPDSSGGSDVVTMAYALDGRMTQRTDQRGTVIDFTYNDLRQLEKQVVSTLGGSTDGTIRAIKREYDNLARLEKVTSYSDTSASTAKNQIEYDYDDFGQVVSSWQEHDGVKDGSTLGIGYTYDYTASSNLLTAGGRLASTVYPSGTLSYGYGTSGSFNDALSRVGALFIQNAAYPTPTETSNYQYSGVNRVMETRHESLISEVALTRYIPATPGDYVNLDRFGRVKSQIWKTSSSLRDQQDYDHDLAGNRIQRDLPAALTTTHDQLYTYDGLNRLENYQQGTIATGAIASPTKDATWELDGLGNWANYVERASGTTTLDQDRDHNAVNEIGTIGATTGANWIDPVHDAAGNMIEAPQPGAETTKYKYIWDAWNRLVKVTDSAGTTTIAEFAYDGLNRRIAKIVGSDTYHYYLSEQNQVLEEQKQVGAGSPTLQNDYIWHPHYVDALAIRYDVSGVSPVAYYALHDANYNITAMVDGNGAVVERYQYTPYGQVICTDPSFANPTATSTIGQRNLYTGRELDLETGLYYYRARYYHNALGRFIGRDPIEYEAHDTNLYRYVEDNPIYFTDSSGLDPGNIAATAYEDMSCGRIRTRFPTLEEYVGSECTFACASPSNFGIIKDPGKHIRESTWAAFFFGHQHAYEEDKDKSGNENISLRHCMASAYLVRAVGCECAACIGNAREHWQHYSQLNGGTGQDMGETQRGEYRNSIGRQIAGCEGKRGDTSPPPTLFTGSLTNAQIVSECIAAFRKGDGRLNPFLPDREFPEFDTRVPRWPYRPYRR